MDASAIPQEMRESHTELDTEGHWNWGIRSIPPLKNLQFFLSTSLHLYISISISLYIYIYHYVYIFIIIYIYIYHYIYNYIYNYIYIIIYIHIYVLHIRRDFPLPVAAQHRVLQAREATLC